MTRPKTREGMLLMNSRRAQCHAPRSPRLGPGSSWHLQDVGMGRTSDWETDEYVTGEALVSSMGKTGDDGWVWETGLDGPRLWER